MVKYRCLVCNDYVNEDPTKVIDHIKRSHTKEEMLEICMDQVV